MSWSEKINSNVNNINCSKFSNGQYVIISNWQVTGTYAGIQLSSNFGTNFTQISPTGTSSYPWEQSITNSNGKYLVACTAITSGYNNGYIYASSSSGVNWTLAYTGISCGGLASNSTGEYVVCSTSSGILRSTNYGFSWTSTGLGSGRINCVTSDSTGQYLVGAGHNNGVYYSNNYGSSWSTSTGNNSIYAFGIASDSTGQFVVYSTITAGGIYRSINYGQSFTQVYSGNFGYRGIYSNSTGTTLIASAYEAATNGVYISTNSGTSWTAVSSIAVTELITSVASNSNGTNLYATGYNGMWAYISDATPLVTPTTITITPISLNFNLVTSLNASIPAPWTYITSNYSGKNLLLTSLNSQGTYGGVYTSSSYGTYWTQRSLPSNVFWIHGASDSTGQYLAVASNPGNIYTSSSYGVNWTQTSAITGKWEGLTSDSSGRYLAATMSTANIGIYISSSYGVNWTKSVSTIAGAIYLIAYNSNGQYGVASSNGGGIYTSSNYGTNWTLTSAGALVWAGITINGTGQYLAGCATGNGIYTSSNYGVNWIKSLDNTSNWQNITNDISGKNLVACISTSGVSVYISSNYGVNWNTISSFTTSSFYGVASSSNGKNIFLSGPSGIYTYLSSLFSWELVPTVTHSDGIWQHIVCSSTGKYVAATTINKTATIGGVYISSTYGINWIQTTLNSTIEWFNISMNSNGQYMAATMYPGDSIYTSSSYGINWIQNTVTNGTWKGIACDSSGKYLSATIAGVGIYNSSNYGSNWTKTLSSSNANFYAISSNATGQYLLVSSLGVCLFISSSYGTNWFQSVAPTGLSWFGVTINSTGQYMAANVIDNGIYTSSNYGNNWIQSSAPLLQWRDMSSDQTGRYLQAGTVTDGMYMSSNYGSTWKKEPDIDNAIYSTASSLDGSNLYAIGKNGVYTYFSNEFTWVSVSSLNPNAPWDFIACNSTGQYVVATTTKSENNIGGVYISSSYGTDWRKTSLDSTQFWIGIAISSSGQYISGCAKDSGIFTSSSYGINWRQTSASATNGYWESITCNSTGQYLAAGSNNNGFYTSSNYGTNWTKTITTTGNMYFLASNHSGQYMGAIASGNGVYISSTYGANWNLSSAPTGRLWFGLTINSTGQYMAATIINGGIYASSNYGTNWVKSSAISNLSWFGISSNESGQYLLACSGGGDGSGVYTSSDYGMSWTVIASLYGVWFYTASNYAGTNLYAIGPAGTGIFTYVSNNLFVSNNLLTNILVNNANYPNIDLFAIFAPYTTGTKAPATNIIANGTDLNDLFAPYQSDYTTALSTNLFVGSSDLAYIFNSINAIATFSPNENTHTSSTWSLHGINWTSSQSSQSPEGTNVAGYTAFYTVTSSSVRWVPWNGTTTQVYGVDNGTGIYTGTFSTVIQNGVGTKMGEWIQIGSNVPLMLRGFSLTNWENTGYIVEMPNNFFICGSNDNSTWYPIIYISFNANPATISNPNGTLSTPIYTIQGGTVTGGTLTNLTYNTYGNSNNNYSYFRMAITQSLGGSVSGIAADGYMVIGNWRPYFSR
jgi:hypothetical protein